MGLFDSPSVAPEDFRAKFFGEIEIVPYTLGVRKFSVGWCVTLLAEIDAQWGESISTS